METDFSVRNIEEKTTQELRNKEEHVDAASLWKEMVSGFQTRQSDLATSSALPEIECYDSSADNTKKLEHAQSKQQEDTKQSSSSDQAAKQEQVNTSILAKILSVATATAVTTAINRGVEKGQQHPDSSRETRESGSASASRRSPHLFGD